MHKQVHTHHRHTHRVISFLAVSALALGLSACDKPQEPTVGQRLDSAVEKTEQAAAEARSKAQVAARQLGEDARKAADAVAVTVDDATITAQVMAGLAKDSELSALKISVETKAGAVTLSGPAVSPIVKERAGSIAHAVPGVRDVRNQLTVAAS